MISISPNSTTEIWYNLYLWPKPYICTIIFIFHYNRIDDDDIEKDGGHGSKLKLPTIPRSRVAKKAKEMRLLDTKNESAVVS